MLRRSMPFEPTTSQSTAIQALATFLASNDARPTMLIRGFAGTGKTSLMRAFCDVASQLRFPLELMAPTGRAAKVLSETTGRPARTIHKCIYRQQSSDFNSPFSLGFNRGRSTIYIVDEASMISDSYGGDTEFGSGRLLTDLVSFVFAQEGCRLLLIGDPAQLPPVGLNEAPALDVERLRNFNLDVTEAWLTDIVRQEISSEILTNASRLRQLIENQPDFCGYPLLTSPAGGDVERITGTELIETLITCYDRYGSENTLVVTRSNKRANRFNHGIRGSVMFKEEELTRGDLLIVSKNNYLWLSKNRSENDHDAKAGKDFIANGDIAEVVRINSYQTLHGHRFANASLRFIEHDDIDIDVVLMLDALNSDSPHLSRDDEHAFLTSVAQDYIDIVDRRRFYEALRNDQYFNALQVRFAYAITCHKAQGGQWDAVFIDLGYIAEEMLTTEFLKWLYTAFTRARKKLYLVNFSKEFFE